MKILLISPVPTHRPHSGIRARVLSIAGSLRQLGHDIHFVWLRDGSRPLPDLDLATMRTFWGNQCTILPFTLAADARIPRRELLNKSLHPDQWYDSRIDPLLSEILAETECDLLWVEYAYLSKAFEVAPPGILRVLDTIDRFAGRSEHMLGAGVRSEHLIPSFANNDDECAALRRADCIVAIQEAEGEIFSNLLGRKVWTLGHRTDLLTRTDSEPDNPTIAFLASESYVGAANFKHFQHSIFPLLRSTLPGLEVIIGGGVSRILGDLPPGIRVFGETPTVGDLFCRAHMVINSDFCATGLSIKNLTALGHGMPLVTSANGARGLEAGAGSAFLLATSDEQFVDLTLEILTNTEMRTRLSEGARHFVMDYNTTQERTLESLLDTLDGMRRNPV
ncbi:MAG: glycosyltransferase [Bdellovibrionales bacterium]|nr:glycosyltransferase [Bdellovibrionales bacterium]